MKTFAIRLLNGRERRTRYPSLLIQVVGIAVLSERWKMKDLAQELQIPPRTLRHWKSKGFHLDALIPKPKREFTIGDALYGSDPEAARQFAILVNRRLDQLLKEAKTKR